MSCATRARTLILVLALIVAGCGPDRRVDRAEAQEVALDLSGTRWELVSLDGEPPVEGSRITIAFEKDRLTGFAGCNHYGADYTLGRDGNLEIVEPTHHVALCTQPEGVMEQEGAFVKALCAASALRTTGDRLEIEDAAGTTRLIFRRQERLSQDPAALVGTRWELLTIAGAEPLEGTRYTLSFDSASALSGEAACRAYRGTYEAIGDELRLRFLEMAGDPCLDREEVMRQEGAFTTALGSIDQYRLTDDHLEFLTVRGEELVFARAG